MVAAPPKTARMKFDLGKKEQSIDCLKVLPYLWQGGQFKSAMHIALELDCGTSLVRSRAEALISLGLVKTKEEDFELTDLGQDFCQLIYSPVPKAKGVVSKFERNLLELALKQAQAYPDKNKGRIELLRKIVNEQSNLTPVPTEGTGTEQKAAGFATGDQPTRTDHKGDNNTAGVEALSNEFDSAQSSSGSSGGGQDSLSPGQVVSGIKEYYRIKTGLHPVRQPMEEHTIACHLLPVEEQIQLCRQRLSQQQARLTDLPLLRQPAAQKLTLQVDEAVKEELNRISQLSAFLPQPDWVNEAEEELNDIQAQLDNCFIEADKAKDGSEIKKALQEQYKISQQALRDCLKRYSNLAIDCGYSLCYQEFPGETYNQLTVWAEKTNAAEQETTGRSAEETATVTGLSEGTSRSNQSGTGTTVLLQQSEVTRSSSDSPAPTTDGHTSASVQPRQGQDLVSEAELTPDEEQERNRLEKKVDHGLYSAWAALREIRDRKLYRPQTWEAYCLSRFGYKNDNAGWKIHAADVYEVLEESLLISRSTLPTSEQQVRALRRVPQKQWQDVWAEAVEQTAGKKPPSGRIVQGVVDRIKGKVKPELSFLMRDVVIISRPIKYSGCWGVVTNVGEFTISVSTWKEVVLIEDPDKVTRLDSPSERQSILEIWKRCKALRECPDLDPSVYWVLEGLGRQTFLTEVQEELLTLFENKYL